MAHADRKHMGVGSQGKQAGSGALTDVDIAQLPENAVLKNRDKAQQSGRRGQDGKWLQSEQLQDHEANKLTEN